MKDTSSRHSLFLPTLICGLAALFYLYEFVLQVSPAIMTYQLMHAFSVSATGLSAISAFYYYAYTPMQLPAGMLYDRFGPRIIMTWAIFACAVGAIFFGMTTDVVMASLGRFFMGAGSAFSFIGALLLISRWFPARMFALLAGITQLMSSIGAIIGQVPLSWIIHAFGWRESILGIGIIGFFLALFVYLIVRDKPSGQENEKFQENNESHQPMRLKQVINKRQTWYVAIYAFASWAPVLVFAALWGVAYIATRYDISIKYASIAIAMIWLGIGIGSPLVGWWSDYIGRRNLPLFLVSLIGLIAVVVLLLADIPLHVMYILLFLMGFAASGQSLSFGTIKDINHPRVVGTAIGFNNMAVVAGGMLLQPLAGFLIQYYWDGRYSIHHVPIYSIYAYQHAMLYILPVCYLICMIMSAWFIKETHCHHLFEQINPKSKANDGNTSYEFS